MYRGRYFTRSARHVCGDRMEVDVYPVFQPAGKRRRKCRPTSEIQQRLNQRNAAKKLTRLVRLNFGQDDLALHLTYRPGQEPETAETARRDLQNYIRRLKKLYRKQGRELKYICATEHGKKTGRVHHHLIVTGGIDRNTLEECWGKGFANSKRLQIEEDGLAALSHYMVKDGASYKRWSGSRNLIKPEPIVKDNEYNMGDVEDMRDAIESRNAHAYFEALHPGWELVEASCAQNGVNRGWYIAVEMRRKREKRRKQ